MVSVPESRHLYVTWSSPLYCPRAPTIYEVKEMEVGGGVGGEGRGQGGGSTAPLKLCLIRDQHSKQSHLLLLQNLLPHPILFLQARK
jgi:hypothetical protein